MAVKMSDILGLNARNHAYTSKYNRRGAKKIADSKLLTKSALRKVGLPAPRLYRVFRNDEDVETYDFSKLGESFVLKPNRGLGGEGIVVVEKLGRRKGTFVTADGETIQTEDLKLHAYDILAGRFSMNDLPDIAYIEERIRIHPAFKKYAYHGTPDIRVVVFNKVPVMAMLRIPTQASAGRANLFQGAVGAGIDLAAGVTTYAIQYAHEITTMPDTGIEVRGLKIPVWDEVLKLAIDCQMATGLGYLGADIVLQPSVKNPGKTLPKVLELNAQPGLKIQLCNRAGLRRRLERVEGLEVESAESGIKIAQELFGDRSLSEYKDTPKSIGVFETVEVMAATGERMSVKTKVDTGAFRTSIDRELAMELGLVTPENILMRKQYESALGKHVRDVIGITFYLAGKKVETTASVSDRVGLRRPMIIGRRDLGGFEIAVPKPTETA